MPANYQQYAITLALFIAHIILAQVTRRFRFSTGSLAAHNWPTMPRLPSSPTLSLEYGDNMAVSHSNHYLTRYSFGSRIFEHKNCSKEYENLTESFVG
ncbi:hypothetical protein ARMSODRAFT_304222 [Armillaria solidipes]|uniref:Uncharacterized protein n=1 Tax=Armillaria solidipes TaxID=1076256 RepID=A0A2H3BTD1_9AGAR|nr:hypothetical protein ARMSODRAFT_304222 [Armillaria solidipes]